ncbi:MAG TPA: type VI secretion system tip protein VgrG, partial [Burkholderiaceae bacterium]|nr:type VI secretion system tip protein VgrG [Burkholderiaceae bacterium]
LHKTRMTIKSKSHKGDGYNELRFEDERDREEIYVHAQKDQNIHVNHNESTFIGNDRSEQVQHDETIAIGHDRKETVGNDEHVTIGNDRRHSVTQDDFLDIGRNHVIRTAKDRIEEVGNHRIDKTMANHLIDVGGHVAFTVRGHHQLAAGKSIERKTLKYDLQASENIVIKGPGGTITIDSSGITLEAIAIQLKGPISQSGGSGNQLSLKGVAEQGRALNSLCAMRSDGTCPLEHCPCGRLRARP